MLWTWFELTFALSPPPIPRDDVAGILHEEFSTSYGRLHFRYVLIVGGPISAVDRPQSIRIKNEVATATAMLGAILLWEYTGSLT
ncbi:hypothetical protein Y032_0011g1495 [Ancylostoma ceylanicum]|nr:hypothetical protein Y032_0011g1495 [Ancylostoma ceylanicum]